MKRFELVMVCLLTAALFAGVAGCKPPDEGVPPGPGSTNTTDAE